MPGDASPEEKRREAGGSLNECLFSYYYGTFGMLFGVGTPISIKIKNYWPAVTAGMLGTLMDYTYASYYGCAPQMEAYRLAAEADVKPKLGMQGPVKKTYYSFKGQIPPPINENGPPRVPPRTSDSAPGDSTDDVFNTASSSSSSSSSSFPSDRTS